MFVEPYSRYILLTFYMSLLNQWIAAAKSNGEVNLILNQHSNLAYVYDCLKNNFGPPIYTIMFKEMICLLRT